MEKEMEKEIEKEIEREMEKVSVPVDKLTRLQKTFIDTCSHCAVCADACPTYIESNERHQLIPGEKLGYLHELLSAQKSLSRRLFGPKLIDVEELTQRTEDLYTCTLCGRCTTFCSFGMDLRSLWPTFREIIYDVGFVPESIKSIAEKVKDKKDPLGLGFNERESWINSGDSIDVPINKEAKVVYLVGCYSTFKNENKNIAVSFAKILNHIGEDWTIMGKDEICCGSPAMKCGDTKTAKELMQANVDKIESLGAKTLVTGCAECYRMFRWEYPRLIKKLPRFKVLHAVELINQYVSEGKLKLKQSDRRITYHDPCDIARLGGVLEEPRTILRRITENFVDMPESKLNSVCCGGGGLLNFYDPDMASKIGSKRIKQVEPLNVDLLVSACPSCKETLHEAAEKAGGKLEILDIIELIAQQLE
ncbi:MAG: (Fe-S)-binding protein [Candidatus Hodarchaeales archaeon]|jgi:heterodisulfide reductase subunit D